MGFVTVGRSSQRQTPLQSSSSIASVARYVCLSTVSLNGLDLAHLMSQTKRMMTCLKLANARKRQTQTVDYTKLQV